MYNRRRFRHPLSGHFRLANVGVVARDCGRHRLLFIRVHGFNSALSSGDDVARHDDGNGFMSALFARLSDGDLGNSGFISGFNRRLSSRLSFRFRSR